MWCLDIDGTLTAPGEKLAPGTTALLTGIVDHVVLITAQAKDYCDKIGAGAFPNLVTEKGMVVRIDNVTRQELAPPEVPGFVKEMTALLDALKAARSDLVPVFNVKTAGYAVGDENLTADERAQVLALMKQQKEQANGGVYVVEETAGFIDITLSKLSKASSLVEVSTEVPARDMLLTREQAMKKFPGGIAVACGDSANTDGPMLQKARDLGGNGIMVTKTLAGFPTVADHNAMIEVLACYAEILGA